MLSKRHKNVIITRILSHFVQRCRKIISTCSLRLIAGIINICLYERIHEKIMDDE